MSKIGNKQIDIEQAKLTVDGSKVTVSGPKGTLTYELPQVLTLTIDGSKATIARTNETKSVKSLHGLFRSLLANAVHGVQKGWEKKLEVVGTGYGVSLKGADAVFKVGYSHQVTFPKRTGLTYVVDGTTSLVISGADKQQVGEAAHLARMIKPPDAYKGKGVRYAGEVVKLKPGKKVKTA